MESLLQSPQTWISLLTLTVLEVVLGIDNIIFISILASKLAMQDRPRARKLGLVIAMIVRILLLLMIGVILRLKEPIFTIPWFNLSPEHHGIPISVKDLVLIAGGIFLVGKATHEIHNKLEGETDELNAKISPSFSAVMVQMFILNIVFSIDSVVTAIGMANELAIMIAAVVLSSILMLLFSKPVALFVEKHPTVKMLALSFLILIGVNLVAEGFGVEIPKGYTYFAMAFAFVVEMLNLKLRKSTPVQLHQPSEPPELQS